MIRLRSNRDRLEGDRGAAVVEFALAMPILVLLVMGAIDYGAGWMADTGLVRAASIAARTGASQGDKPLADFDVLQSVGGSMESIGNLELTKVVVYKATGDGKPPQNCLSADVGIAGLCNVYTATKTYTTDPVGFPRTGGADPSCAPGAWDYSWCPTTRDNEAPDFDHLGVYLEATFDPPAGFLATSPKITAYAVYQVEPRVALPEG